MFLGLCNNWFPRTTYVIVITIHQRHTQTDGRTDMSSQDRALHYRVLHGKNDMASYSTSTTTSSSVECTPIQAQTS